MNKKLFSVFFLISYFFLMRTNLIGGTIVIGYDLSDDDYLWSFDHFKSSISTEYSISDDLDNDGNVETIVGTRENGLFMLDQYGEILWHFNENVGPFFSIFCYDINNNNNKEILVSTYCSTLIVLDINGSVVWQTVLGGDDENWAINMFFEDVNNDSIVDIIYGERNGPIKALDNNGSLIWTENSPMWKGGRTSTEMTIGILNSYKVILASDMKGYTRMINVSTGNEIIVWNEFSYTKNPENVEYPIVKLVDLNNDNLHESIIHNCLGSAVDNYWVIDGLTRSTIISGVYDQDIMQINGIKNYNTNESYIVIIGHDGHITCKNLENTIIWEINDSTADKGSVTADINGDNIEDIILSTIGSIKAFSGADGTELWENNDWIMRCRSITKSFITQDDIADFVVSLGNGIKGQTVVINGRSGETIFIFNGETFKPVWDLAYLNNDEQNYVIVARGNDNPFYGKTVGIVTCINGLTGELIWENMDLGGARSLIIVEDTNGDNFDDVVVSARRGSIHLLDGSNGDIIWENVIGTTNNIMNLQLFDMNEDGKDDIVFSYDTDLFYIDVLTGEKFSIISFTEIGQIFLEGNTTDDLIIAFSSLGYVCTFNYDQNLLWNQTILGCAASWGLLGNDMIIVGESILFEELEHQIQRPSVYAFNLESGDQIWKTTVQGRYSIDEIIIRDVNNNGNPEIFTRNTDYIDVFDTDGNVKWSISKLSINQFAIGEFNGDYRLDIGVLSSFSGFEVYDANEGTFIYEYKDTASVSTCILTNDLNGDNICDVAIGTYGGSVETSTEYSVVAFLGKVVETGLQPIEDPSSVDDINYTSFSSLNAVLIAITVLGALKVSKKKI